MRNLVSRDEFYIRPWMQACDLPIEKQYLLGLVEAWLYQRLGLYSSIFARSEI